MKKALTAVCQAYFSSICVNPNKSADKVINWVSVQDLAPVQEIKRDFSCRKVCFVLQMDIFSRLLYLLPPSSLYWILVIKMFISIVTGASFSSWKESFLSVIGNGNPYTFNSETKAYRAFNYSCILLLRIWPE